MSSKKTVNEEAGRGAGSRRTCSRHIISYRDSSSVREKTTHGRQSGVETRHMKPEDIQARLILQHNFMPPQPVLDCGVLP